MKLTGKQILIAIIVVVVILIAIAFWFYHKGKKTTTIARVTEDNPNSTAATNNPYAVAESEVYRISDNLYKDMHGFNWAGHDVQPYQDLNALSDTDFERVYNRFNKDHQTESEQTLRQWIESEDFAFNDVQESILTRMDRLSLI